MMSGLGSLELLAHAGYLLTLIAYVVRDILVLRALIVVACATMALYFAVALEAVAWTPFAWQLLLLAVNAVWIVVLLNERRAIRFTEEERELHETLFREFTALEFMKLLRAGEWCDFAAGDELIARGAAVDRLYLISNGEVRIARGEGKGVRHVRDGGLLGEMSFLVDKPASATVTAVQPTRCLAWNQQDLRALLRRNPSMRSALMSVIGSDLTRKLASMGGEDSGGAEEPA